MQNAHMKYMKNSTIRKFPLYSNIILTIICYLKINIRQQIKGLGVYKPLVISMGYHKDKDNISISPNIQVTHVDLKYTDDYILGPPRSLSTK